MKKIVFVGHSFIKLSPYSELRFGTIIKIPSIRDNNSSVATESNSKTFSSLFQVYKIIDLVPPLNWYVFVESNILKLQLFFWILKKYFKIFFFDPLLLLRNFLKVFLSCIQTNSWVCGYLRFGRTIENDSSLYDEPNDARHIHPDEVLKSSKNKGKLTNHNRKWNKLSFVSQLICWGKVKFNQKNIRFCPFLQHLN